jgi:putative two-component system response regulator
MTDHDPLILDGDPTDLTKLSPGLDREKARTIVSQRAQYSQVLQNAILGTLADLVETREMEASQHIPRTRRYVEVLATRLAERPRFAAELTPARISLIGKASQLHDIGKIGIPERILLKPGGLDATEFEVVKTHSRLGGEILTRVMGQAEAALADCPAEERQAALAYLDLARAIAISHHERWDGTGYPEGLAGEAIPLPARLMALADVFDAFTTRRVYKPAWGLTVTRDYIQSQSGKQFDPQVVEAFLAGFDEFAGIAQAYPDLRNA